MASDVLIDFLATGVTEGKPDDGAKAKAHGKTGAAESRSRFKPADSPLVFRLPHGLCLDVLRLGGNNNRQVKRMFSLLKLSAPVLNEPADSVNCQDTTSTFSPTAKYSVCKSGSLFIVH